MSCIYYWDKSDNFPNIKNPGATVKYMRNIGRFAAISKFAPLVYNQFESPSI